MRSCKRRPDPSPQEVSDDEENGDDPQSEQEFAAFKKWLDENGASAPVQSTPSAPPTAPPQKEDKPMLPSDAKR